jgi:steroid 5-alpha reductase family enzyme
VNGLSRAARLCALTYVAAGGAAVLVAWAMRGAHPIWAAAAADALATIVVFAFSRGFDNSSLYDPYWSVAPLAIVPYFWWAGGAPNVVRAALVAACIACWGLRLTYNWARRWGGLHHEDWRYVDLRQKHGARYWVVSFVGIHFVPTVLVFLGCLPIYWVMLSRRPLGALDAAAVAVTVLAIAFETLADRQLHEFASSGPAPGSFLRAGLWRYSRHPNYFGEVLFWWGVALFGLAANPRALWLTGGAVAITLLFVFVSIPLIDERMLARRSGYAEYASRTSALVPWKVGQGNGPRDRVAQR